MKKFYLFYVMLSALFFVTSCDKNELVEGGSGQERPILPSAHPSVSITGDGMIASRSSGDRVEFTGGYATGAGLYNGDGRATVEAVPYEGYSLASFTGGPIGGNPNQFSGANRYGFPIESQDWKFSVSFKKEFKISVIAGEGGVVSGGGTITEGESCTVNAVPKEGYSFDGWYEGSTKVSSSNNFTFTVSSNRTLTAKFVRIYNNHYLSNRLYEI